MTLEPALTVKQLADKWQVCQETIRRQIRGGKLRAFRAGGHIRIPQAEVELHEGGHQRQSVSGASIVRERLRDVREA